MTTDLFHGGSVYLKAVDPQQMAEAYSRWSQDTEYWRLMSGEPCQPMSISHTKEMFEGELDKDHPTNFMFAIHTIEDDKLIGEVGFEDAGLPPGDAYFAIGLGDREYWGKGLGSEATGLILRYAFTELNLKRISLTVSSFNPRAIHTYLKLGFKEEGRLRGAEHRDGERYDLVFMGLLRSEWEMLSEQE